MKNIQKHIKNIINKMGELLYPSVCPLCGELSGSKDNYVCGECKIKISYIQAPMCLKCGKEIKDEEQELCEDCKNHMRSFVRGFPAINYDEAFGESIAAFKYNNKRDYAKYFAYEIVKNRGREILSVAPEALVPVPIHRKKLRSRGYNQAELLANELGSLLHLRVDNTLLERTVNTLPQKKLDNEARELNLKKAFISTNKIVEYNRVMLVDDIYTTGATVEACTRVLKSNGIQDVYYTSICIGRGY